MKATSPQAVSVLRPVRSHRSLRELGTALVIGLLTFVAWTGALQAGTVYVPNASFESPAVPPAPPYAGPDVDSWQKTAQPGWYDTNNGPWTQLTGIFYNVPYPGSYIDNCDGSQAAFLFALPDVGLFQDYNSISGTNTSPDHAFNAQFQAGRSYNLTVGLIGGGGGMTAGASLQLSLYYRDASNNLVTVAATSVVYTTNAFTTNTHLVDFQIHLPTVKAGDAWAGKNIGVELLSTANFSNAGGYWDLDNVRLVEGIDVPNGSFESPAVPPAPPYAGPDVDNWQKTAQPGWYDTNNGPWTQLTGIFYNVPYPGSYIDNCDGSQAAFLFALPDVGLFQDYNSISGTNTTPDHALNAKFTRGKAYALTVGLIGGGGSMAPGVSIQLSLYYRDGASNLITVAATNVVYTTNAFPTNTHLVDFQVQVPGVKAGDPWAGQNIGIQLLSTANFGNAGGYWDLDNVRLSEVVAPALNGLSRSNRQFNLTVQSEPGLRFEILATTNVTQSLTNWISLGNITNVTGATAFTDTATNFNQRFYRAHQL